MKTLLFFVLLLSFFNHNSLAQTATAPLLGDVAQRPDGQVLYLTLRSTPQKVGAYHYCYNLSQHLPTAREYAQYAIKHGAQGLIESSEYKNEPGYKLIRSKFNEAPDVFYYNSDGYKRPTENHILNFFWTASFNHLPGTEGAYVFNGSNGQLSLWTHRFYNFAVRCAYN